jgi:hypothetical protein
MQLWMEASVFINGKCFLIHNEYHHLRTKTESFWRSDSPKRVSLGFELDVFRIAQPFDGQAAHR